MNWPMDTQDSTSTADSDLESVLHVINELTRQSAGGGYIYRGEPKFYSKISSSLYRPYQDIEAEDFDIKIVQQEVLGQARMYTRYTGEVDDFEILSQLQHNGGATNLIDFTTDYLIALFFACDGEPDEQGRVILLSETGSDYDVREPSYPVHRVIAQKSVFVLPDNGFIEPNATVPVDSELKPAILDYLRNHHGISSETIYNDLHGFIRHTGIHQSAYTEFYKGVTSGNNGDDQRAIDHYTTAIRLNSQMPAAYNNRGNAYAALGNFRAAIQGYVTALSFDPEAVLIHNNLGLAHVGQGNYAEAVRDHSRALLLDPNAPDSYCLRGEARLHLSEWDDARADLTTAMNMGYDIVTSFRYGYKNVTDFEQQTCFTVPDDIAELLGGREVSD